jgi:ubiquilin
MIPHYADYEFRRMMTDPASLRQAAAMQRAMGGFPGMPGMPGGGDGGFPAPGVTDTTPTGAAGTTPGQTQTPGQNPMANMFGAGFNPCAPAPGAGAADPFALFPSGQTPAQTPPAPASAGQITPSQTGTPGAEGAAANPFASLFPGAGGPGGLFGNMPPPTPEQLQQFQQMFGGGGFGGGMYDVYFLNMVSKLSHAV